METADLNAILGRNVRRYRLQHGLSQEDLAERCGLHRTYVGSVERGERNVTLRTVQRFAAALRLDPLDLLRDK